MRPRKTLLTSLQIGLLTAGLAGSVRAGNYDSECRDRWYAKCDREYEDCMNRAGGDPEREWHCDDSRNSCEGAAEVQFSEEREEANWTDTDSYEEQSGSMCRMVDVIHRYTSYHEYCFDGPVGEGYSVEVIDYERGEWYACDWGSGS